MTTLDWTLLILRYLHILSAITLMGGTVFAYFAAVPGLAELPEGARNQAHAAIRGRWNKFVMLTTLLLLVSGVATMVLVPINYTLGEDNAMKTHYTMWTGIKFVLALPIFFFAALLTGRTSLAQKIQAKAKTYMAINLALALSMVLIGGALRFIAREAKTPENPNGQQVVASSDRSSR